MPLAVETVALPPEYKLIVDALPNPLVVLDQHDRVVAANTAAEDFFQASSSVLMRHNFSELVPFASPALQSVHQVR